MTSNRRPYWRTLGTPISVVYRTPDGGGYAVHFPGLAGIADGVLAGPPPSSEPDIAQAALVQKAEELTHRRLDVSAVAAKLRVSRWTLGRALDTASR